MFDPGLTQSSQKATHGAIFFRLAVDRQSRGLFQIMSVIVHIKEIKLTFSCLVIITKKYVYIWPHCRRRPKREEAIATNIIYGIFGLFPMQVHFLDIRYEKCRYKMEIYMRELTIRLI